MFVLRIDGVPLIEFEEQVTGVRILTSRGEAAAVGLAPTEGVIDIIVDKVAPGGPMRLDQLEAAQLQQIRDRSTVGQAVGTAPLNVVPGKMTQDIGALATGTPQSSALTASIATHPTTDLTTGLVPGDTATITARVNDFTQHGDADKAIADNPPGSGTEQTTPPAIVPDGLGSTPVDSGGVPVSTMPLVDTQPAVIPGSSLPGMPTSPGTGTEALPAAPASVVGGGVPSQVPPPESTPSGTSPTASEVPVSPATSAPDAPTATA